MGHEKGPEFYTGEGYKNKYNDNLPIYKAALDLLSSKSKIIELGCGVGYFAKLLNENKIINYLGIDFSPKVIEIAKTNVPNMSFIIGNLLSEDIQKIYKNNYVYILLEVLEHIEKDLEVIKSIPLNSIVIISVPNRDYPSHVRFFKTKDEVINRYSTLLDFIDERIIDTNKNKNAKVFMFKGRRK